MDPPQPERGPRNGEGGTGQEGTEKELRCVTCSTTIHVEMDTLYTAKVDHEELENV